MDNLTEKPRSLKDFFEYTIRTRSIIDYERSLGLNPGDFSGILKTAREREKDITKPIIVFDLGCGQGAFLQSAEARKNEGADGYKECQFTGLDLFPEITYRKKQGKIKADFNHLPLKTGSVDIAISICGLGYYGESQDDILKGLKELTRVLKENGRAYLSLKPNVELTRGVLGVNPMYGHPNPKEVAEYQQKALNMDEFTVENPKTGKSFTVNITKMFYDAGLKVVEKKGSIPTSNSLGLVGFELVKI